MTEHADPSLKKVAAAAIYNLLAGCFTNDREYMLDRARSLKKILESLGMVAELGYVEKIIELLESDASATSEYVKLFDMGIAPPYETSYTCRENPELKTYEMADIAGFYKAFNVKTRTERPDHIKTEMEFMALLLAKEAVSKPGSEEREVCREARQRFYEEHLSKWTHELALNVKTHAVTPLYTYLTNLITAIVSRRELIE
jgi:TorA maturation chaperone TorD